MRLLTQQHSITSQKTPIFNNAVSTSKPKRQNWHKRQTVQQLTLSHPLLEGSNQWDFPLHIHCEKPLYGQVTTASRIMVALHIL